MRKKGENHSDPIYTKPIKNLPMEIVFGLSPGLFGAARTEAPDTFETFWALRSQRARETPARGGLLPRLRADSSLSFLSFFGGGGISCLSLRGILLVFLSVFPFPYAGSGLPRGPFLGNNLFPLKLGKKWVFMNGLKWVQKWVKSGFLGAKVGQNSSKPTFAPTLNQFRLIHENPLFTQFKGGGNCFPKKVLRQSRPSITLSRDFRASVRITDPCFIFCGFPCLLQKRKKERKARVAPCI